MGENIKTIRELYQQNDILRKRQLDLRLGAEWKNWGKSHKEIPPVSLWSSLNAHLHFSSNSGLFNGSRLVFKNRSAPPTSNPFFSIR